MAFAVPTPSLEDRARDGEVEAMKTFVCNTFGRHCDWALRVVERESSWQPGVVSPTGCKGLFQMAIPLHNRIFEAIGYQGSDWDDPIANTLAAKHLFDLDGKSPWRFSAPMGRTER